MSDMSLLPINDGVFGVLATAGDIHLGSEAVNNHTLSKPDKMKTRTNVSSAFHTIGKLSCAVE